MPTYEYRCNACKHEFELFQSMTAKPVKKCPECGKNQVERLIGLGAGVLFKGSGFYETDYRSDSYKKAAASETKPSSGGDSNASSSGACCPCGKKSASECASGASKSKPKKDA